MSIFILLLGKDSKTPAVAVVTLLAP